MQHGLLEKNADDDDQEHVHKGQTTEYGISKMQKKQIMYMTFGSANHKNTYCEK